MVALIRLKTIANKAISKGIDLPEILALKGHMKLRWK